MRIVFVGSVKFSKVVLEKLLMLKANIIGIVTKTESQVNSDFADISVLATNNGIPVRFVNDINHENNVKWIRSLSPDVIFCFGWSNLLKKDLLQSAPMGVVGYHPALLPANKGRHPLIWAKVLGLSKTGSTFFFMDEGADSGDIISQEIFKIDFTDDAEILYERMTQAALTQVEKFLPLLVNGNYERLPQPKGEGNTWRKRGRTDGLVDFRMSTKNLCNLIRALSRPYVGAHCWYNDTEIKIWKAEPGNCMQENIEPGKVLSVADNIIELKTGDSSIFLTEHEFEILPQINNYIN
jgi:methionyl-tRNA formyltransferase